MTHHKERLPLADYDDLPVGVLEGQVRGLPAGDVAKLLDYEMTHGHRTHVVEVLRHRLDHAPGGFSADTGKGGLPGKATPTSRSGVSPATAAAPHSPPPHGTSDQSGRPKGNAS
ncbi:hypothetical protein HUT18_07210 [Streptomyces sp. NA04227]|uniref:hypothetical protein n=1 Tax=Streptomyces sp. NA04227 TaxID=2742136 RepID=UPI001590274B|nr:hypothetical protein [Streptomyces sp. NA04227]QKW06225.1 hypothetical protein HUT18_07210 [Streptomyces sp. NA04227]